MKKYCMVLIVLIALPFGSVCAMEDISGIWQGKLVTGPDMELTVQFKIKKEEDGSYSALINSPDQVAIKNIPASSVTYDSNSLKIEIPELRGSFEGIVKDSIIDGKWLQEEASFPLSLTPYKEPGHLSEESMEILMGKWHGDILYQNEPPLLLIFRFEKSKQGYFLGFLDVPTHVDRAIPLRDIILEERNFTFKNAELGFEYKGQLDNDEITGEWIEGGQPSPLSLKKGEVDVRVTGLNLPKLTKDQLLGHWHGNLEIPGVVLTIVAKFEETEQGEYLGCLDMPDLGQYTIAFNKARLQKETLILDVNRLGAKYRGQLAGNKLVGVWEREYEGTSVPLSLKKGKAPVKKLQLPQATMGQLLGRWKGKVDTQQGPRTVIFRFEKIEQGDFVGFVDFPGQGQIGITISEASLEQGILTFKLNGISVEYKGEISGDKISGQWTARGKSLDVPLERIP